MINPVGTIWGTDVEGQPRPIAVHRVGDSFRLTGDTGAHFVEDRIEAAIEAAARHFGLSSPTFGPSRLPVRDLEHERRGTHPSYGWQSTRV